MVLKRKVNKEVPHRKQIIKVNPYENAENVMELMANICSAQPSVDTDTYWNIIRDAYDKQVGGKSLKEYLNENRVDLFDIDFRHDLNDLFQKISLCLDRRENTEHTQIVVAGGFSSGKSSFLNRLTNCVNLLPTGVEPVSVVKTYLYCSENNNMVSVKGVNLKNVLVNLDTGVLQAIQHAKQSNVYLASVLDKLFVEIPSKSLDGIVFIDTPGYNNSNKANKSNGKTDRETALEALKEGNVLFWLVDCERGTTVTDDIEIIKQFEGKKVFIFNKADKKGYQESEKIVENAARVLYKEFPQDEIIDIIAFSTLDNKIYYSKNKKTLSTIVTESKREGNGISELNDLKEQISELFDDEIDWANINIDKIKEVYKEKVALKNERESEFRKVRSEDNDEDYITRDLRKVLVDSYEEVFKAAKNITHASLESLNEFRNFLDEMVLWDNSEHECWVNTLRPKIDSAWNRYNLCCDRHNSAAEYSYYNNNCRKNLSKRIQNIIADRAKDIYDLKCKECKDLLDKKAKLEAIIKNMQGYQNLFMGALDMGIRLYKQQNKATTFYKDDDFIPNVFESIQKDNYKHFLLSFEKGVDLSVCNTDGYNPLTFAVQAGNNQMVQFLLDHNADPSLKDRRGYNAFHTAVENQYRDICKLLLEVDPDLISTETDSGESAKELAQKATFAKWIEQEINYA